MAKINLPIWVLVPVGRSQSPEPAPAFSDTGGVAAFMHKQRESSEHGGNWRPRLVSDKDQAMLILADLQQSGIAHIVLDSVNGTGGTLYTLAEFRNSFDD